MINIYNSKVAVISDIHFGIHGNSEVWHKIILDYGYWLKSELELKNIKDILVLGDIFNDREEIGVKTLSITEQFLEIFNDPVSPFNIILLNGNHDSYLRDSSAINSISIFKGWRNINVIDKITQINAYNRVFTFVPWGAKIEDIPNNSDILFGHLEINTFKKNNVKLCEDGIDSSVLFEKSKMVMSGHFHMKDERIYDNSKIVYVGAPYQQNWGDVNATRGYFILNLSDLSYEFTENTISPTYHKFNLSTLFETDQLAKIKKIIPNNFIKIIVDKELDYPVFEKIMNSLTLLKPLEISSDFNETEILTGTVSDESVTIDTKTLISEFVKSLDINNLNDKVIKELEEIYDKSITKVITEKE